MKLSELHAIVGKFPFYIIVDKTEYLVYNCHHNVYYTTNPNSWFNNTRQFPNWEPVEISERQLLNDFDSMFK